MTALGHLDLVGAPGVSWPLGGRTTVGRSADADITLEVAEISRLHVRIDQVPTGFTVSDLGSRNGTFVNGEELTNEALRLVDGDEILLPGRTVLRFVDAMATPMAPRIGKLDGVWIDPGSRAVWVDAQRVEPPLSERQLALLELLHRAEGELVDRPTIVAEVWADVAADGVSDQAISALIKRTKARLAEFELNGPSLDIVRSRGVRLIR